MVHSWRKLIIGALIPVIILGVASYIRTVDEKTLAIQDAFRIIACVAIGMEIILIIEQFGLHRLFRWRENLLRSRLLNSKIMWIALPFILALISYVIDINVIPGRMANAMAGQTEDYVMAAIPPGEITGDMSGHLIGSDGRGVDFWRVFTTSLDRYADRILQSCATGLPIPCYKYDGSVFMVVTYDEVAAILEARHPPVSYAVASAVEIVPNNKIVPTNNIYSGRVLRAISEVFLIAAAMVAVFDMLWLIKHGLGFFAGGISGINNNFRGKGVFFGMWGGRMAGRNQEEDGHILVVGGAGSGKSSSIAIPTLAKTWESNFLAIDIKGELAKESGRRACIFNPCDAMAYGYDPFYFVEKQDNPTAALQEIAITLVPESPGAKEPFWTQSAQSILTGHLIFTFSQGASFYESLRIMQTVETRKLLRVDSEHEEACIYINKFLDTPQETLGSIMAHVSNAVVPLIGDPDIKSLSQ